jgi:hypothetical protein
MRTLLATVFVAATAFAALAPERPARREIENVAAFTRLYGVVRYFYPSDAAASLDWDRFAVHGVKRARGALTRQSLKTTLEELFTPLGPGITIGSALPAVGNAGGSADASLVAWRYLGAGVAAPTGFSPYAAKRTHRTSVVDGSIDGFVAVMQTIPAASLRGQAVRLRGQVRSTPRDATGSAALWLRIDRPGGSPAFFDNMSDRPVRIPEWREYQIEGTVSNDASDVVFGALASGSVTADFDAVDLSVRNSDGTWSTVAIKDPGFEAPAEDAAGGWARVGTSKNAESTRPADQPPQGQRFLRFAPPPAGRPAAELFESTPIAGARASIDLGSGLHARVPLALSEADAHGDTTLANTFDVLRTSMNAIASSNDPPDIDTRLAGVAAAWNVLRHFYPYWSESGVDWDARLGPQLTVAYAANSREGQREALRRLVAEARDGHGQVVDSQQRGPLARLPIQLGLVEGRVVVTATAAPDNLAVGSVVSTIDSAPAKQRLAETMRLISGTPQWKEARALQEIANCQQGAVVNLTVDSGTGPRQAAVRCDGALPPAEARPEAVTEVSPGIWYVDLTRARMTQVTPILEQLARAAGLVFDLRGYPTDAGGRILPHLMSAPESDRWMHVAKIIGPFGESAGWQSVGWNLKPASPHFPGKAVFLTDGRAISYAESVMGYVADLKLGTIVGGTTAGTNGNVAMFPVPGGFNVTFTGMRVTRHDGRTPHHLAGIKPDIPVTPTLAGLRKGQDELLDRALLEIRRK